MHNAKTRILAGSLIASLSLGLAGCGTANYADNNTSVYSANQPVVERNNYTLDVATNSGGLGFAEQQRVSDWFDAMDLQYGDRLSIDDPLASAATRDAIAQIAARRGILLSDGAPVTVGNVNAGQARIVLTRSTAYVPNCPNWSGTSDANYGNETAKGYGCAVNGNLAAMVANPEDLLTGQKGTGETTVTVSDRAIETYRAKTPTGAGALAAPGTGGN